MIKKGQKLIRNNKDYVSEDDRSANRWFISIMIILVAICTVGVVSMATGWPTNVSTGGGSTESAEVISNETNTETTEGEADGSSANSAETTEISDGEGEATTEEDGSESAEAENSDESAEAESGENTEENAGEESGNAQEQSEENQQQ